MTDGKPLTEEQANHIWDVLVEHAGAPDDQEERAVFVQRQTAGRTEYRFQGSLGFGGKFWNANSRWYVNTYRESMTPGREQIVGVTNAALAALKASYDALAAALAEPRQETT